MTNERATRPGRILRVANDVMVNYGQIVVGAGGAGKTSYCTAVQHLLELQERERVVVVNLDPANENYEYECALDVRDLVCAREVQDNFQLGPNGSLVFCMEYLVKNMDWLEEGLRALQKDDRGDMYVVFDCPGQIELFATHGGFRKVLTHLEKTLDFRFVCVHCVDVHLCTDAGNYLAAILLSLNLMLNLELPHVNVLTKCDMIAHFGDMAMPLDYYLEAQNLSHFVLGLDVAGGGGPGGEGRRRTKVHPKFTRLTEGLCDLVEDYALVNFVPMAIEDAKSMQHLLRTLDRCLGYVQKQDKASQKGGEDLQSFIASLDAALHDTGDGTNQNWQEHFINFKALTTEKKREEPKNPIN